MKTTISPFAVTLRLGFIATVILIALSGRSITAAMNQNGAGSAPHHRLLLFKFQPDADTACIADMEKKFEGLRDQIDGLEQVIWGNDLKSDEASDYTHAVMLTFSDVAAIPVYEAHPDHLAIIEIAGKVVVGFHEMNCRDS